MSSAVFRRGSSKESLKNLLRLTAQRSIEDEEEIARERRRRARETRRYDDDENGSYAGSTPSTPAFESHRTTKENQYDLNCKSTNSALDEDEGFSDWTQRREERRQKRREEQGLSEEGHVTDSTVGLSFTVRERREQEDQEKAGMGKLKTWQMEEESRMHQRKQEQAEESRQCERKLKEKEEVERAQMEDRQRLKYLREEGERLDQEKMEKERWKVEIEKRPKENEMKLSIAPRSWIGDLHYEEENDCVQNKMAAYQSYRTTKIVQSELPEVEEDGELARLEAEQKLEQIRRSLDEKETQEYERLRQRGHDNELELEELNSRREERRKAREEEEQRRQVQEQELQAKEEEEKRRMREEREKRRMEAAEKRQRVLSVSGSEMEDPFVPLSPKSPTLKKEFDDGMSSETTCLISERTESLNRSLKKSNSVKKSQPITNISKIDDRLEQYTNAIESTTKSLRHASVDIPNLSEDVATMKSLWETGDPASNAGTRGTPCKEIKPGDVRSKKNIWETKSDSPSCNKLSNAGKPASARYKFVVTGHGKYEKVPIADEEPGADASS
ncbi:lymphocyte-specific protein 1 isoform X2 [Leucoraja erinacea]|uniref:lymphocyte-specific protein 1 isoform X2 n=1 Tax=Leucoraja erinaceus TaxID=7782 RepID=UPI002454C1CC|nr:lymphocyte-specific protein 1 isoform X2 [Leucoraja erinacea]